MTPAAARATTSPFAAPFFTDMSADATAIRARIHEHLHGLALVPSVAALADCGVFELLAREQGGVPLDALAAHSHARPAYLRVALRLLASCGWLVEESDRARRSFVYRPTPVGALALDLAPAVCRREAQFLKTAERFQATFADGLDAEALAALRDAVLSVTRGWDLPTSSISLEQTLFRQLRSALDGTVMGPAMVALGRAGFFELLQKGSLELLDVDPVLDCLFELLSLQQWLTRSGNRVALTPAGRSAAALAPSYGAVVSYLPMLNTLHALFFGKGTLPRYDNRGRELLLDRATNVWGSGAHRDCFASADAVIVELFSRPIAEQPVGLCDVASGDGCLLEHLYSVIRDKTARGSMLHDYPVTVIAADTNKIARDATLRRLRNAGVPRIHVLPGNISRPSQLARDIERYRIDMRDLLHVRSFADHSRAYGRAERVPSPDGEPTLLSTGAFADTGKAVAAVDIQDDLVRHLRRWRPFVDRFGLLVFEWHTLPPDRAAAAAGLTAVAAYDAIHGYSDQYALETPVFLECAAMAGLDHQPRFRAQFPSPELVVVSLSYFTAATEAHS
jgi:hypothetical protein